MNTEEAMTLHLYNSLGRAKSEFVPLNSSDVKVYVCGPTVYSDIHIGNARPIIVFDVLVRLLRYFFPHVTYVRNITDVDDKILARAKELGEPIDVLTARTVHQFHQDIGQLGALEPDFEPRATQHISQMVEMIRQLVDRGFAYVAEQHVMFHVPSAPDYGLLSGRSRDEMIAGARVEPAPYKKDPADFVLWKPSSNGEMGWDSPWGRGRPGWHIECSAMSVEYLGADFDIHGGGEDLIFPHHENEIAQSCCANPNASFARVWLHNGYLQSEGAKMSKSLDNFYTVKELLGTEQRKRMWRGEAIRLMMLGTHYRKAIDFRMEGLEVSKKKLDRWYRASQTFGKPSEAMPSDEFMAAVCDDLNTPLAIAVLDAMCGKILAGEEADNDCVRKFVAGAEMLGLLQYNFSEWFQGVSSESESGENEEIEALIRERSLAKRREDFKSADTIRQKLEKRGVIVEDKSGGKTVWRWRT